jgi:hypothetical protein
MKASCSGILSTNRKASRSGCSGRCGGGGATAASDEPLLWLWQIVLVDLKKRERGRRLGWGGGEDVVGIWY